ncbi:glucose-1-phosphate thymidylyltransferase RfbA [Prochlorococcus sp. AH-736-K21]|nr:glucose-1-phosphate thymidylyltransferase RfbA [Prochlorococcus sp. AH-736-K21]MDA9707730.1 glucose-1-phosphate thymidylyltransferase RfbA [Prochlorococcus sp. AH-736-K21]
MIKNKRKGIIMSGGYGTRLAPITSAVNKQLLPIYDKPMIYYPISTLMMAGIDEILIITSPLFLNLFKKLLGDGSKWNIKIEFAVQDEPKGLAEAFILGEKFIDNCPSVLILGDNIFHGTNLIDLLLKTSSDVDGATIFAYKVKNPESYGVINFKDEKIESIEEKPQIPKSNYAITGIYFYDSSAVSRVKQLKPSKRGELEITDLNNLYLVEGKLKSKLLGRGYCWFDAGSIESLNACSQYVQIIENRQGLKIGCPEEVAWRNKWINETNLLEIAKEQQTSSYGEYLLKILKEDKC